MNEIAATTARKQRNMEIMGACVEKNWLQLLAHRKPGIK